MHHFVLASAHCIEAFCVCSLLSGEILGGDSYVSHFAFSVPTEEMAAELDEQKESMK